MAKISANGAFEVARAKSPVTGNTYVLTSDGRLLRKFDIKGDHFVVVRRGMTGEEFERATQGMTRKGRS